MPTSASTPSSTTHKLMAPSYAPVILGPSATRAFSNMTYGGGAVEHHIHVYLIFWGPGYNGDPQGVVTDQQYLFNALGGSTFNGILTQHSDSTGAITNDTVLSGSCDRTPFTSPPTMSALSGVPSSILGRTRSG
jgi:hypothetical protein